jgi:hypothetical protein
VHAIVLVQSDNPATYSAVLGQLLEPGRGVTKITWAFLESDVNKAMVPTASTKLSEESYQRVNDIRDLDSLLRSTSILDVSGVPKDTLLQVFALTAGRRNVHLWTLSRTKANITVYVPLTSNPMIAAFRRSVFVYWAVVWTLVATALLGVLSLVLALLGGYDSSSPFITWLSLFVGVVSFVLGASLTPIRGKRSTSEA